LTELTPQLPATAPLPPPSFNPFRIACSDDPYPQYHQLREQAPVHPLPSCLGRDWVFTRYRDCEQLLRDARLSGDDLPARIRQEAAAAGVPGSVQALCDVLQHWLFFIDGAQHRRLHRLVSRRFSPAELAPFRAAVEGLVDGLLDQALLEPGGDLMAALARPLPTLVAARLLGFAAPDVDRLTSLAQDLFSSFDQPSTLRRHQLLDGQARGFQDLVRRCLDEKRRCPAGDLGTDLIQLVAAGELTEDEAVALAIMVMSVGQDTTQHLIGNAVWALLRDGRSHQLLQERPEALPGAVRELARWDTPVQLVVHLAREDLRWAEVDIRAGERLHFLLGAAHRDPEVFVDPDRLDLTRPTTGRLMFGAGAHFCLGAHLALLQAEVALGRLLTRCPRLRPGSLRPRRIRSVYMRGFAALPVLWQ
jgi:pimeloyl-[acyl-carrier protein] synthase